LRSSIASEGSTQKETPSFNMARFAELVLVQLLAAVLGYEWAGIFETPNDHYMWTAQKVDGDYADATMKLVVLEASDLTEAGLESLESAATSAMNSCTEKYTGQTITPGTSTCYRLNFDPDAWQSLYPVNANGVNGIAFFAEHFPTEFESTAHYLKDQVGEDIEPLAELPHTEEVESEESIPAGAAIGSSVLVNLVTFIGVLLMVPAISKAHKQHQEIFNGVLFAFAAGAMLSCAFFLLLFEATHLVAMGWDAEVDVLWRWGTMILAGMIVPAFIESLASACLVLSGKEGKTSSTASTTANSTEEGVQPEIVAVEPEVAVQPEPVPDESKKLDLKVRSRLIGAVLIGDFFHNLCDGFFIGAAFKGCGDSFGWGVAAATILHELPQELADFAVLTSPEAGLSNVMALVLNFLSGISVLLGVIVILYSEVSDAATGLLLAFGGGVYIHIGAVDCMPKMYNSKFSLMQRLSCFASFIFGAVAIGLILIGHEHCVPDSADGHGHGGH